MSDEPLPFDDILDKQVANPDVAIGPTGQPLDERLLPRGKSKARNSKHKKRLLENGLDELDAAKEREEEERFNLQKHEDKLGWLKDPEAKEQFIQMVDLGATNDQILRNFPSLAGSVVALSIARKRCGITRERAKQARELNAVREREQFKKDKESNQPSLASEEPVHKRLSTGEIVYLDGTNMSTGKLDTIQNKKKLSFYAAFRDAFTYDDGVRLVEVLKEKAFKNKEPWAIIELSNRCWGKPEKGMLNNAVQNEIVDQMDMSKLNASELRALADVVARMAGTPESDLNKPDFVQERSAILPGASNHQLPPPA